MIRVTVAPSPVSALLGRRQFVKIAIGAVRFSDPLAILDDFVIVPSVIVVVIGIIRTDGRVFGAPS
jgi:hypothetical protein